ncbi:hypothetical protein AMS68_000560 [Peltaster fructicola]|uniref:Uncharacterized protein n=1 Tax=Peltaster fructicola TaxID=286661 RepID=A0A6H0XJY2_9PEZI|nr:hypothetical protein AMS68_000560 [Peltaster fructicola]
MSTSSPCTDCVTDIAYLGHAELYKTVKPYVADYAGEGIARSNLKTEFVRDVCISDLRSKKGTKLGFWKDGFEVLQFNSTMTYDEWSDQETVESKYCAELGASLIAQLGAVAVQAFEAVVRRRHVTFPDGKADVSIRGQPALRPHIGIVTHIRSVVDIRSVGWLTIHSCRRFSGPDDRASQSSRGGDRVC